MIKKLTFLSILVWCFVLPSFGNDGKVEVKLDVEEVPHLKKWGENARELMLKWYPRILNIIPTKDHKAPGTVTLKIRKSDKGIAFASGAKITVSSHWIEKHPGDIGLVVHELVHVIQKYRGKNPGWLVEGIADYIRWGIYEGKTLDRFNRPKKKQAYTQGYQSAAGFLLWLETEKAAGIVSKLNTHMRQGTYKDELFKDIAGSTLDELWDEYAGLREGA